MNGTVTPRKDGKFRAGIYIEGKRFARVFKVAEDAKSWLAVMRARKTREQTAIENEGLRHPGVVYFVGALPLGAHPIKIGFSKGDADSRLVGTQVGNPLRLFVLAKIEGSRSLEAWLHRTFAGSRMHGEWFEPVSSLVSLIASVRPTGHAVVIQASYRFQRSIA